MDHMDLIIWTFCVYIFCIIRAFDTLAKVLHPADGSAGESLEATMQLMSGDQSGPVVELEGPLLSDSHFPFKVKVTTDVDPQDEIQVRPNPLCFTESYIFLINTVVMFSPVVLPAYDAFACARVPQCQLHLWVSFPATFSLYALGTLYSCLSNPWVSRCHKVFHCFTNTHIVLCHYMSVLKWQLSYVSSVWPYSSL